MTNQRGEQYVTFDDRPERENVIEKDEILSLIIDIEIMSTAEFYRKYFGQKK
ncbi:MAG: hypothetical protein JW915_03010 [Chitinispirillaceae bacterium]|nr:hypothetical protein [Chitinispirillaceae bacterium]